MRILETTEPDRVKSAVQSFARNFLLRTLQSFRELGSFLGAHETFFLWEFEDYNDYQSVIDFR